MPKPQPTRLAPTRSGRSAPGAHSERNGPALLQALRVSWCATAAVSGRETQHLGNASTLPPDFGLAREINASRTSGDFYAPRPIVQAEIVKPEHPIFYGYHETTIPVKYANGPLLQVPGRLEDEAVLMKFVGGRAGVLSGLMNGAEQIRDRPAVVGHPVGQGRLLIFTTNPVYRWQNHGEFNLVFNALLNYDDLGVKENPGNNQ
jgi:hypothetical protein